jgi:putative ABC transport system permease protein
VSARQGGPGQGGPERRAFRVADRRRLEQEVEAELSFHVQERIEELMGQGMSREDAEAEVRRRFGDPERIGSEVASIDRVTYRRRGVSERVGGWAQSLRQVLRGMWARPGYSAVVILTLALAIGANTAIFSAVDAVLLRPLPVPELERLVAVQWDIPEISALPTPLSAGEVNDLTARTDLFRAITGFTQTGATLTGLGDARRVAVANSIGDVPAVFGLTPLLGTFYAPDASVPGNEAVAVIGHGLWMSAFGGDPGVVGQTITLDDRGFQVVGVLPPDFRYPGDTQIWRPFALTERALSPQRRRTLNMMSVARLQPGVTTAMVDEQLGLEVRRWDEQFDGYGEGFSRFYLRPFAAHLSGDLRGVLLVLLGAVSFVLAIACANVASLQLVRTSGRTREIAVRVALGAGRASIVRHHLVESLTFAVFGGLGGVVLGSIGLRVLAAWDAAQYPMLRDVRLDGPVLAFTAAVTLLSGLVFGGVPAWRASRTQAQEALKESGGRGGLGRRRHRFLQGAVVAQLALTLVLLVGSGVMARSLARLLSVEPGFRSEGVITMQITPPTSRYGEYALRVEAFDRILGRLRALPGVEAVALTGTIPFSEMILDSSPFEFVGAPPNGSDSILHATAIAASPELFRALGVRMLAGRTFEETEGTRDPESGAWENPVGVIDEQFARQYFPGVDPVGRRINHYGFRDVTIVGVVESVNQRALAATYKANIYYPYRQLPFPLGAGIVVRSTLEAGAVSSMVASAIREIDPELPVYDVRTLEQRVTRSLGDRSLAAAVLGGFAALALVLALLGTYGVLSYSTAQRTQELGIRLAVGARPDDVVGMVLGSGARLVGAGLLVGMLVYLGVARVLESMVYGIGPRDPVVVGVGLAVLLVAALLASWFPARRAAKLDPVDALRSQ